MTFAEKMENLGSDIFYIKSFKKMTITDVIVVPGYLAETDWMVPGSTYYKLRQTLRRALGDDTRMQIVSVPNSNHGDRGNTTFEQALAFLIRQYNDLKVDPSTTLVIGHSLGGLLVHDMLHRIAAAPRHTLLINPAFLVAGMGLGLRALVTVAPTFLYLPIPVFWDDWLFEGSVRGSFLVKQRLSRSILCRTGQLLPCFNRGTTSSGSSPDSDVRIVHCIHDRLSDIHGSRAVQNATPGIILHELDSPFHEPFDDAEFADVVAKYA